jgi:adenylate cyclase class IV
MPRNVEVKAKVHNKEELVNLAQKLCKEEGTVVEQDDTFFVTEKGRLKLRIFKVVFFV